MLASLFPDLKGLTEVEIFIYKMEHFLGGLINPMVLILSDRYYVDNLISLKNHVIGQCFLGLYLRIFLFLISSYTLVNLNASLCPLNGNLPIFYYQKI